MMGFSTVSNSAPTVGVPLNSIMESTMKLATAAMELAQALMQQQGGAGSAGMNPMLMMMMMALLSGVNGGSGAEGGGAAGGDLMKMFTDMMGGNNAGGGATGAAPGGGGGGAAPMMCKPPAYNVASGMPAAGASSPLPTPAAATTKPAVAPMPAATAYAPKPAVGPSAGVTQPQSAGNAYIPTTSNYSNSGASNASVIEGGGGMCTTDTSGGMTGAATGGTPTSGQTFSRWGNTGDTAGTAGKPIVNAARSGLFSPAELSDGDLKGGIAELKAKKDDPSLTPLEKRRTSATLEGYQYELDKRRASHRSDDDLKAILGEGENPPPKGSLRDKAADTSLSPEERRQAQHAVFAYEGELAARRAKNKAEAGSKAVAGVISGTKDTKGQAGRTKPVTNTDVKTEDTKSVELSGKPDSGGKVKIAGSTNPDRAIMEAENARDAAKAKREELVAIRDKLKADNPDGKNDKGIKDLDRAIKKMDDYVLPNLQKAVDARIKGDEHGARTATRHAFDDMYTDSNKHKDWAHMYEDNRSVFQSVKDYMKDTGIGAKPDGTNDILNKPGGGDLDKKKDKKSESGVFSSTLL
jgi:hypothetical protein